MQPGLQRLLDLIRSNPQDTLLLDRFLVLSADLNETDRATLTLELSEVLLRRNPRKAIELAYMVYKSNPGDAEPLEIMVEGLENLGRYGKATVLRQQLQKVRQIHDKGAEQQSDALQESLTNVGQQLQFLDDDDVEVSKKTTASQPQTNSAKAIPFHIEFTSQNKVAEENLGIPSMHVPPVTNNDKSAPVIPEQITPDKVLELLQRHIREKSWDAVYDILCTQWSPTDRSRVIKLVRTHRLFQIDLRFLVWWLDILIDDRRPRYALTVALRSLKAEPHIRFAKELYPRIVRATKVLKMRSLFWQEDDGVLTLLRALKRADLVTAASVGIFDK